jgi:hypothetical protein
MKRYSGILDYDASKYVRFTSINCSYTLNEAIVIYKSRPSLITLMYCWLLSSTISIKSVDVFLVASDDLPSANFNFFITRSCRWYTLQLLQMIVVLVQKLHATFLNVDFFSLYLSFHISTLLYANQIQSNADAEMLFPNTCWTLYWPH